MRQFSLAMWGAPTLVGRSSMESLGPIDVSKTSTARSLVEAARPYAGRYRAAGVAVAGPVEQGKVVLTNADWRGSVSDLDVPVRLVNDLEAVAFSIPLLTARDIQWWGGRGESLERVLCLGIGTGFGGALFTPDDVIAMEPDMSHYTAILVTRRLSRCVGPVPRSTSGSRALPGGARIRR